MDSATVVTADPDLRELLLRWCAAAGLAGDEVSDVVELRSRWRGDSPVLIGHDLAGRVAAARLPRRDGVLVVGDDPERWWRTAVELGAASVLATDDDVAAVAALGSLVDGGAEGCTIAVVGGSGGVGASTFAAALAVEAARRALGAVVVDADPHGAGVELVLGAEAAPGLRWPDLGSADGRVSAASLAEALPRHRGVATVSWSPSEVGAAVPDTADAVWTSVARAFELAVVDLPVPGDAWTRGVAAGAVLTVLVVADDVAGVAAARRRLVGLRACGATVAVVVANRRAGLGPEAVERTLEVPVVGRIRPDRHLRLALDHGAGPRRSRTVRRAAAGVLDLVGLSGR